MALSFGNGTPTTEKTAFVCPHPHCGTKTSQTWHEVRLLQLTGAPSVKKTRLPRDPKKLELPVEVDQPPKVLGELVSLTADRVLENAFVSVCMECGQFALWFGSRMQFPNATKAPPPSPDMPDEVKADYEEAGRILSLSPRGAAALLRLAVEKLCIHLGYKAGNINAKIGKMVEDGLPQEVEQALDVVRVVGNNAVHPGHLDMKDDVATATQLFGIVNFIVRDRLTRPKELANLFATKVPDTAKEQIEKRRKKPGDAP